MGALGAGLLQIATSLWRDISEAGRPKLAKGEPRMDANERQFDLLQLYETTRLGHQKCAPTYSHI